MNVGDIYPKKDFVFIIIMFQIIRIFIELLILKKSGHIRNILISRGPSYDRIRSEQNENNTF